MSTISQPHHPDPADELEDINDSLDALSADFRASLGLLPASEEGLTDAFKERLGVQESIKEVEEIELAFEETRIETLNSFKFAAFAKQNFLPDQTPSFSREVLQKPLLPKTDRLDNKVSIAIWLAIQRFMGDLNVPNLKQDNIQRKQKMFQGPIMTLIFQSLDKYRHTMRQQQNEAGTSSSQSSLTANSANEKEYVQIKRKKQSSMKKVFGGGKSGRNVKDLPVEKIEIKRGNHYGDREAEDNSLLFDYSTSAEVMASNLPSQDLDLIHFIIGHAILRKQLRDETYCQLCKLLSSNPSPASAAKGWMLMLLCAGCFQPTNKFIRYLIAFLRTSSSDYRRTAFAAITLLKRTRANGTRYHPPCELEFQALMNGQLMQLPVYLADGRVEQVQVDSASTSGEMCRIIANRLGIKDNFGFSIYISVMDMMSSLGSGSDHIMDALSECDQFLRSTSPNTTNKWQIIFRKELFSPWYDPSNDDVATNLIFAQICKGIKREEYRMRSETELARFIARRYYIDHGPIIIPGKLAPVMPEYMPISLASSNAKQKDFWMQIVIASFQDLGLAVGDVPLLLVRDDVVRSAPFKWPLQFSGLFEAYRLAGPHLPRNDLILAISCLGLSILDDAYRILHSFQLYEIVDVSAYKTSKAIGQNFTFSIVSGEEFTFICPNTETICKLLNHFLEGLRRRSQYAVALQDYVLQASGMDSPFAFCRGDVIELKTQAAAGQVPDWYYGKCERTGLEGPFPFDSVYILPAIDRPPNEFLDMFRMMSVQYMSTLPRKRGLVILSRTDVHKDTLDGVPVESVA